MIYKHTRLHLATYKAIRSAQENAQQPAELTAVLLYYLRSRGKKWHSRGSQSTPEQVRNRREQSGNSRERCTGAHRSHRSSRRTSRTSNYTAEHTGAKTARFKALGLQADSAEHRHRAKSTPHPLDPSKSRPGAPTTSPAVNKNSPK